MKKFIYTVLLSSLAAGSALAQQIKHERFSNSIHDDGKTMSVGFNGTTGGKTVNYQQTFAVAGMSQKDKDALVQRIADSLGIAYTPRPRTSTIVSVPSQPSKIHRSLTRNRNLNADVDDNGTQLHMKFNGVNSGNKQIDYDRVFIVSGWDKQKKNALIRHVTDSLGISDNVSINSN